MKKKVGKYLSAKRLDIVAGLIDGILSALILAAGKLANSNDGSSPFLAVKVGLASASTTIFVFFVAHYAEARADLFRAEQELNLLQHGRLVTTKLGRWAARDTAASALVAALCSFSGSTAPLLLGSAVPNQPWLYFVVVGLSLAALGAILARSLHGSPLTWAASIVGGGVLVTFIGLKLSIVS